MRRLVATSLLALITLMYVESVWAQPAPGRAPPPARVAPVRVAPPVPATPPVRIVPTLPQVNVPEIRPRDLVTPETVLVRNRVAHLEAAQQAGSMVALLRQRGLVATATPLGFLGGALVSFSIPEGADEAALLGDLSDLFPGIVIAPNDALLPAEKPGAGDPRAYGRHLVGWPDRSTGCARRVRLGMVDSGIDLDHPAFADHAIAQRWLVDESTDPNLLRHGTAIAALLVGEAPEQAIEGLAPGAVLLSAAVFIRDADGNLSASVENTVIAIDWLGGEAVDVINLSIAGRSNTVLQRGVSLAGQAGLPMVAAAGNEGRDGPRAYPAASQEVLAVTALDQRRRPYRYATQGAYIDVAAPGVDVWTAASSGGGAFRSGTSVATPFVSVMVGALRVANPAVEAKTIYATLRTSAEDLGPAGHDPVFGWGLARMPNAAACGG